jgi:hypothetical protein
MSYEQLYDLTPRTFWNAVDGYYEHIENQDRKDWIRTRWTTCCLINIQLPKGKQITLQKLAKFDWEEQERKIDTYEEVLEKYHRFEKVKKAK